MREPFHTLIWKASVGYNDSWSRVDPEVLEKFAELIVKECVDFIDEFGSDLENGDVFGKSEKKLSEDLLAGHNGAALWRASDLLRERFGVE